MATKAIPLELLDDNPYNPRKYYPEVKVREMAQSLREHGLRQLPEGRSVNGRVQLCYGHMRKRGYLYNQKKDPYPENEKWNRMPIDVKKISDQEMFDLSIEENLRRTDITPIEVARCIQSYSEVLPDVLDEEIARKHCMTASNVSNMKRVLRLPDKILEKIDAGQLSFTQGRALLTLEGLENADNLMVSAISGLRTGNKSYGHANTVEGLQVSIHDIIKGQYRPLDKEFEGYRWDLLFDSRAAGCLQCEKMIRTNPTKSKAAHYCTDGECWDRHDNEHREKAAAAAKAQMEAEILARVGKDVRLGRTAEPELPQFTLEKRGSSWIALDAQGIVVAIDLTKKETDAGAVSYFSPVSTKVNPGSGEYILNHTYRFIEKPASRKLEYSDVTAQDLATAAKAMVVDAENIELVKVWKSSGKLGTGGYVSAGWSKCTETLDNISQEMFEEPPDEKAEESRREQANLERPVGELPCETCIRGKTCERRYFRAGTGSGQLVCDEWQPGEPLEQDISQRIAAAPAPPQEIPDDLLEKAKAAAGTRAEVLDIRPLKVDDYDWRHELKSGYVELSQVIDEMDDPGECLERCTTGFHYAFDSKYIDREAGAICTDPKCASKKKSALTRKRHAAGQGRKKAEMKAIKEAIAQTTTLDRPRIKLILLAQIHGAHASKTYYGGEETKRPSKWLWDKISAGTPDLERKIELLFKKVDKLSDEELAKLMVEFMFYYLVDHGDVGSHEIKTEEPLKWLGQTIEKQ